jgi:hypothetical protein
MRELARGWVWRILLGVLCLALLGIGWRQPRAQSHDLSMLTVNVNGFENNSGGIFTPWPTRYHRIALWARQNNVIPDIIALQEFHG